MNGYNSSLGPYANYYNAPRLKAMATPDKLSRYKSMEVLLSDAIITFGHKRTEENLAKLYACYAVHSHYLDEILKTIEVANISKIKTLTKTEIQAIFTLLQEAPNVQIQTRIQSEQRDSKPTTTDDDIQLTEESQDSRNRKNGVDKSTCEDC